MSGNEWKTAFVNCPFCGNIVEVVSPIPNRKIIHVKASKDIRGSNTIYETECACTKCENSMRIIWNWE